MSQVFERSDQLKDVVFDVKLRIPEWKVLFAVDGEKDPGEIASFLEMPPSDVSVTLDKLRDMQLVSPVEAGLETPQGNGADQEEEAAAQEPSAEETLAFIAPEVPAEEQAPEFEDLLEEPPAEEEVPQRDDFELPEDLGEKSGEDDEDLDELIGNLLEEEDGEEESPETGLEELETAAKPDESDDFDLGSIFDDETGDAEESLTDMLGDLGEDQDETALVEEPPPVAEPHLEEPLVAPDQEEAATILVVDDSVVIRKMVEIALENENYAIVAVATGKEALTYLDENDPDLIILDIMLSDVNGLDVLKAIKASKQIPVVMLSAKDTPRETTKAKQLGADDFIPKPFKDEELVSKIKELIKK